MTNINDDKHVRTWASEDGILMVRAVAPRNPRNGLPPLLVKQFQRSGLRWDLLKSYDNAKRFNAQEFYVATISDLAELIDQASKYPDAGLVRGALSDGSASADNILRRLHHREGESATFVEVKRRWVAIDLDSFPLPEGVDPIDVLKVVPLALVLLPSEFQNASCVWQLTSSAGIEKGGRLRLYFLLEHALDNCDLKEIFDGFDVDKSVFGAVHLIYVAAPIFHGGEDFIPVRIGMHIGAHERVTIERPQKKFKESKSKSDRKFYQGIGFDAYVDQIGDPETFPGLDEAAFAFT